MGHLELNGFAVNNIVTMDHGTPADIFKGFDRVYSGHFHTRSHQEEIYYLGNPYELYWHDVEETKGFHFFDTETLEHTPIDNPYRMFYKIVYEDTPYQTFDAREYEGKIVKVIVQKRTKPKDFEKFIDKLHAVGVEDLKIIDSADWNHGYIHGENFEAEEDENTIALLNRFIDESEIDLNKDRVKELMGTLYATACEVD